MSPKAKSQIAALDDMTVGELREKYHEVFGEPCRARNKQFLRKRIAWRVQALEEGDLSERARQRALEIANDADLRIRAPKRVSTEVNSQTTVVSSPGMMRDERLPLPGTVLKRKYKGEMVQALILDNGFEHKGESFDSLSTLVTKATGTRWNGFQFFGLNKKGGSNA